MRAPFALLATTAFTFACGSETPSNGNGSGASGPPSVEILEEGSGAANEGPLWPLHAGTTMDRTRILGEREVAGRQVILVALDGAPDALLWRPPTYYTESDAGILWHGNVRDGFWSRPILVVPKSVKPGMKWTSDPGAKGPSGKGRPVKCVASLSTPDGGTLLLQKQTIWSIMCGDGYLGDWSINLIEGVGVAASARMDLRSGPAYPAEPEVAASELEPLNGGEPIMPQFFAHRVGSISVPSDGSGHRRIIADGEAVGTLMGGVVNLDDGTGTAVNAEVPVRARACVMLDGHDVVEAELSATLDPASPCPDPLGAAIGGDGKLRSIHAGNYCLENAPDCSMFNFYAIRGDEAGAEVLVTTNAIYSARYYDGADEHQWYTVGDVERASPLLGNLGLLESNSYWLLFGDKGSAGESLVVPDRQTLFAGAWNDRWLDAHPALAQAALAASVTQEGRDVLDVTPEGRISRIVVDSGNLTLSLLARVVPPPDHALVGAVDTGDELLVFTQGNYKGWSTRVIPAPIGSDEQPQIDTDIPPDVGGVFAWVTQPVTEPGVPSAPPPERLPVYLQAEARDLRVSAPAPWEDPSSQAVLGDSPVELALSTTEHSALFVRDQAGPSPLMPNNAPWLNPYLFEADLPSVGHVQAAVLSPKPHAFWPTIGIAAGELAPLQGGGFVNGTQPLLLWSRGGVLENSIDGAEGGMAIADGSGHGLWMGMPENVDCLRSSGCVEWTLWGRERQVFRFDDEPATDPTDRSRAGGGAIGVVGGGVLTPHYLLRPDGTRHFFTPPVAPLGAVFTAWGATEDDTVCGDYVENIITPEGTSATEGSLLCIDAQGGIQKQPQVFGLAYATADGVFYGADPFTGALVRFDPETFTVTTLEKTSVTGIPENASSPFENFVRDANGELFATFEIVPPPTAQSLPVVLHLTRDAVERIDMPMVRDLMLPGKKLLVDEQAFLFLGPGGLSAEVYRVAR